MIKAVRFRNFKVVREATLPLSQCTLLIGPNSSGKTTAIQGLGWLRNAAVGASVPSFDDTVTIGAARSDDATVEGAAEWGAQDEGIVSTFRGVPSDT